MIKQSILLLLFLLGSVSFAQEKESKFPLSASLVSRSSLYISGQIGINPTTSKLVTSNFEDEAKQVMQNLQAQLKANNLEMDDLVSTIVYLKDMKHYELLNTVYRSFFKERFPTRTCIAVADLPAGASVEISGIAEIRKHKKK